MSVLFHSPAGDTAQPVQAGQVLDLTAPETTDGVTVFRRTLYLRLALDGACDRVTLDAAALALRFEPCTVTVARGDADWVRRWQGSSGTVDVELAYPAPVTRVDSALYGKYELYRVDGAAVSEEPTATGSTGALLAEPFSATAFQVRLCGEKPGRRVAEKHKVIAQKHAAHKTLSAAAAGVQMLDESELALQDIDRAVELVNGLSALHLAGTPASPRLTLRSPDGSEVLWQWIEPGQHDSTVDFAPAALAQDWQAALERALKLIDDAAHAAGTPRPAVLALPLEVTSDSPCRVRVQQADVTFLLERPLLDAPATLRFTGATEQVQAITLTPPAAARRIEIVGHFTTDPGAAPGTSGAVPPPVGIYLARGSGVVMPVRLDGPLRCVGVAFGWHPLGARTASAVSLGAPGDALRALAVGRIETGCTSAGTLYARWSPVDLQAGVYALRLTIDEGQGVLAATPDPAAVPLVVTNDLGSRGLVLAPDLVLLAAGDAGALPVELTLNGHPLSATGEPGGGLRALFDPVSPMLAGMPGWMLEARSAALLVMQIETVRVGYTPA